MSGHAFLSPSGASRWLNCTAAPQMEQNFEDIQTVYTAEGSLAHELAELKVQEFYKLVPQDLLNKKHDEIKSHELYDDEMEDHAETYLSFINDIASRYKTTPIVLTEHKVSLAGYADKCFGTADCLVLSGTTLHVIDYKYGKGVKVDAENNPQMMIYALGAAAAFTGIANIKRVEASIVQPRIGNISTFVTNAKDLQAWGTSVLTPKSKEALDEKGGEFAPGESTCRFCKAKTTCAARANFYKEKKELLEKKPRFLKAEDFSELLPIANALKDWAEDVKSEALKQVMDGNTVPGFKAVEGRGRRVWADMDEAFSRIVENGTSEEMLYVREPLSLAKTEKLLGKKEFNSLVGDLVEKKPGKPTLVPETDKREALIIRDPSTVFNKIN